MSINARLVALATGASLALGGIAVLGVESASASPVASHAISSGYVPLAVGPATPKVDGLRFRAGPSTDYGAYGLLYRGDRMRETSGVRRGGGTWFHVQLTRRSASGLRAGRWGWVYASYLRPVK